MTDDSFAPMPGVDYSGADAPSEPEFERAPGVDYSGGGTAPPAIDGDDGFARAPGIDYSTADAKIAAEKAVPISAEGVPADARPGMTEDDARAHHETMAVAADADPIAAQALTAAWGQPDSESFAENWSYARHGVAELMSSDLAEVLDGAGLGDNPAVMQAAATVGKHISSGALAADGPRFIEQASTPLAVEGQKAFMANIGASDPDAVAELTDAWGKPGAESFSENFGYAALAEQHLQSPALDRAIIEAGLGGSPMLLRLAADIGRKLATSKGNPSLAAQPRTPANRQAEGNIQQELDKLMALVNTDFETYRKPETQTRIDQLTRALVGDEPAVGHAGRLV